MKTFEALFKLASKYTGGPGFAAATRDIDKVTKRAKTANMSMRNVHASIGKVAVALGGAAVAYKAIAEAQQFWSEGIAASKDARDVQEKLGVAAERNAKRYKTSGDAIVKSVNEVSEHIAAVGFDSEDAQTGVTKLLESMSPQEIEAFGQAYSDITAKFKGATPGAEGFAEVSEQINSAILKGKAPWLSQLGIEDQQLKAFKKMDRAQRLAFIQQQAQIKLANEANRVFNTTPGKVARAAKAYEDLQQAVTKGVVGREGQFAEVYEKAFKRMMPAAERIGAKLGDVFGHWADLFEQNGDAIATTAENIVTTIGRIPDTALWVKAQLDKIPVLYDLPKHWPELKKQWEQSISDTKAQIATLAEQWRTSVADTSAQASVLSQQWNTSVADTQKQAGTLSTTMAQQWATSVADTQRQAGEVGTAIKSGIDSAIAGLSGIAETVWTTVCNPIIQKFTGMAAPITSALSGVYAAIVGPFQSAYNYISGLFSGLAAQIGAAASAAASAASTASTAISSAKAAAAAGTPVPRGAPGGPGESAAATPAPYSYPTQEHQLGGIIRYPQIARLAERGAEAVIPLTQHRERAQSLLNYAQRAIGGAGSLRGLAAGTGRTATGQQAGPISMSPTFNITINAGPGEEAKTLARSVRRAMTDEVNAFLHTMQQARAADRRLSFT